MSHMAWIRKAYQVPAKRGRKVRVWYLYRRGWRLALKGHISSALRGGPYLWIKSDSGHTSGPYHPRHNLEYLDGDGETLLDTRTLARCEAGETLPYDAPAG